MISLSKQGHQKRYFLSVQGYFYIRSKLEGEIGGLTHTNDLQQLFTESISARPISRQNI